MFDARTVQFIWRYMVYADEEILRAAWTVPEDGYRRALGISQGTVHRQLVHAFESQEIWLARISGAGAGVAVDPETVTREMVAVGWAAIHERLLRFVGAQSNESLAEMIHSQNKRGEPFTLPRGVCMLHVADHATYHRGQTNSMIKLAGGTPAPVMLHTYGFTAGLGRRGT